jgi:hypothetical protein
MRGPRRSELLFTDNETNLKRLFGVENPSPFVKVALSYRAAPFGTKKWSSCHLSVPAAHCFGLSTPPRCGANERAGCLP